MAYKSVTTEVDIDIDLDEFEFNELVDEIKLRLNDKYLLEREKKENKKYLYKHLFNVVPSTEEITLINQMKIDFLMEHIEDISLEQLEQLSPSNQPKTR